MSLLWFRMYPEIATNTAVRSLSKEDGFHYFLILCLKADGTLDRRDITPDMRESFVRDVLRCNVSETVTVKQNLLHAGLVDENWQPRTWEKRQFISDCSTQRVRKHRETKKNNQKTRNVSETLRKRFGNGPETETETDTEKPPIAPRHLADEARAILEFLNEKTGRDFQPVRANLDLIRARLKEGYPPGKLRQIIACKCRQWLPDDAMRSYLRPSTLFGREKCAQYRGELIPEAQILAEESLP